MQPVDCSIAQKKDANWSFPTSTSTGAHSNFIIYYLVSSVEDKDATLIVGESSSEYTPKTRVYIKKIDMPFLPGYFRKKPVGTISSFL